MIKLVSLVGTKKWRIYRIGEETKMYKVHGHTKESTMYRKAFNSHPNSPLYQKHTSLKQLSMRLLFFDSIPLNAVSFLYPKTVQEIEGGTVTLKQCEY